MHPVYLVFYAIYISQQQVVFMGQNLLPNSRSRHPFYVQVKGITKPMLTELSAEIVGTWPEASELERPPYRPTVHGDRKLEVVSEIIKLPEYYGIKKHPSLLPELFKSSARTNNRAA